MDAVEVVNTPSEEPKPENEAMPDHADVCRICLLGNLPMRDLFRDEDSLTLSQKVMSLASVKIMPGDGLPSHICCDCCNKLEIAYKFKLQVEQADGVLREKVDSMNMKDEFFFNDVNVDLTDHRNDVSENSQESLILKEHMDLLNEEVLQTEHSEKNEDITLGVQEVETHGSKEESQEFSQNQDEISIQTHEEEMVVQQEVQMQETSEQNSQFETEELQDLMLSEMRDREELQEQLNHVHQMALDEHNYVAESQHPRNVSENDVLVTEEVKIGKHEIKQEEDSLHETPEVTNVPDETPEVTNVPDETQPNEATRRSQRKINQRKAQQNDEVNYFENLNLSSRLKQVQSDKSEKVFFMCFVCDRQFLSKDVLKEHMHSHDELRKNFPSVKKTPEKAPNVPTNPSPLKSSSSGKQPNTCPHCGKEYLYVISFKKHLQQHEKDKGDVKDEVMPLEVSFREDGDTLDYHDYDAPVDYDSHEEIKREDEELQVKNDVNTYSLFKCSVCAETFGAIELLKNHRMKHVVEGVLSEQDLEDVAETQISDFTTDVLKEQIVSNKEDLKSSSRKSLPSLAKYDCKVCHESFARKDLLRKHAEVHAVNAKTLKSFKCTQCNKGFTNELTFRNHLIATRHKTIVQGQEYDLNRRIKRSAAKAAQKIIDQINNLDESDDERDKEAEKDRDFEESIEVSPIVEEIQMNLLHPAKRNQRSPKVYQCASCNLKFPSKQALAKHMELHAKDESSIKAESSKKDEPPARKEFDDEEEDDDDFEGGLDWPMDSHECPTCKKKYSTKKSLLRHQLLHEEPNFECDICNVKFYRKDKLKAHYDKCSEKNPDQVRKCNICGDTFENNEILREHRTKHVMEGILTEEDLQEIEPKLDDSEGEKAPRKRRTDIVGLECQECNKRYTSRKGLLRHIQVHEGKKYLCDICPKKFYRREHLKLHVAKHNMVKPYKCLKCPKRFIKEEQMQNHMAKHERVAKKPKEPDTPKRFLCEICSKSFTQSTTLIAHLRAHNGIKPYVCEVCSRPFTTNAYLKMHMRTHTQERPYICQYCSRAFARADTLANHLTSHTGEAKYSCKYCPKHFRRLKSLKEHVFIHTGQRPYACPTCDRRFNNNGSRYAHSKRCKQNLVQGRQISAPAGRTISVQNLRLQDHDEQDEQQLQLEETQELRLQPATISPTQIIKTQNIKTITITRPVIEPGQIMSHQDIYMPVIFTAEGGELILSDSGPGKLFIT